MYLLLLSFLGGLFNSSGNCLSAFPQHNSVALLYFKNLSIYIICAVKFIIQFNSNPQLKLGIHTMLGCCVND